MMTSRDFATPEKRRYLSHSKFSKLLVITVKQIHADSNDIN
jgi:hypothetical protein